MNFKHKSGVSLIECILALGLFTAIMSCLIFFYSSSSKNNGLQDIKLQNVIELSFAYIKNQPHLVTQNLIFFYQSQENSITPFLENLNVGDYKIEANYQLTPNNYYFTALKIEECVASNHMKVVFESSL